MRKNEFFLVYALLLAAQCVICNYFYLTPYVSLSLLPVIVLCLPIRISSALAMVIAFATGLAVDALSEGLLGLNTLALVPVALARDGILSLLFGRELFARKEDFTVHKNGLGPVTLAIILSQALFLAVYIWADGAGMRPFWFNFARWAASLAAGTALSLIVVPALAPDTRK